MIENPCEKCKWFELPLCAYPCGNCVFSGTAADHFEAKEEPDEMESNYGAWSPDKEGEQNAGG